MKEELTSRHSIALPEVTITVRFPAPGEEHDPVEKPQGRMSICNKVMRDATEPDAPTDPATGWAEVAACDDYEERCIEAAIQMLRKCQRNRPSKVEPDGSASLRREYPKLYDFASEQGVAVEVKWNRYINRFQASITRADFKRDHRDRFLRGTFGSGPTRASALHGLTYEISGAIMVVNASSKDERREIEVPDLVERKPATQ